MDILQSALNIAQLHVNELWQTLAIDEKSNNSLRSDAELADPKIWQDNLKRSRAAKTTSKATAAVKPWQDLKVTLR